MLMDLRTYRMYREVPASLAEELLRETLKHDLSQSVRIFKIRTVLPGSMPVRSLEAGAKDRATTYTWEELSLCPHGGSREQYVHIKAIVGPVLNSGRQGVEVVKATIRLYCIEGGAVIWKPHFLKLAYINAENDKEVERLYIFCDGDLDDRMQFMETHNIPNPCPDMLEQQTLATYDKYHCPQFEQED